MVPNKDRMGARISHLVESPQHGIPGFVRFEAAKQWFDGSWSIFRVAVEESGVYAFR